MSELFSEYPPRSLRSAPEDGGGRWADKLTDSLGVRGSGIARSASTYVSPVPYRKREQYSDDERGWDASNTTRRVYALRSELYCE